MSVSVEPTFPVWGSFHSTGPNGLSHGKSSWSYPRWRRLSQLLRRRIYTCMSRHGNRLIQAAIVDSRTSTLHSRFLIKTDTSKLPKMCFSYCMRNGYLFDAAITVVLPDSPAAAASTNILVTSEEYLDSHNDEWRLASKESIDSSLSSKTIGITPWSLCSSF